VKVIFEFDKYEDADELEVHLQASGMYAVLTDLDEWMRQKVKYGTEQEAKVFEPLRTKFWEILEDNEVKL
jgi:hypothetical protein